MGVVAVSSRRQQVEELLSGLDVDVDLDDAGVEVDGMAEEAGDLPDFVEAASISVSTAEGHHPEKGSLDDFEREFLLEDGGRVSVSVKRRPECPNCQYLWGSDDEIYNHVFENCSECGEWICLKCWTECSACGTKLCSSCTMGHGVKDETYCPVCRVDVVEEVEHSRKMEKREQEHEQKLDKWEARIEELERKKQLLMKEDSQEHRQKMEEIQKKIEMARMVNQSDSTEEIKRRLEAKESDIRQFPGFGEQFSGLELGGGDEEGDDGYNYEEVFE